MKIIISNNLQITGAPESLLRKIRATFTLENQAYLSNVKGGRRC